VAGAGQVERLGLGIVENPGDAIFTAQWAISFSVIWSIECSRRSMQICLQQPVLRQHFPAGIAPDDFVIMK
jgi:hypothetical protein